MDKKLIRVGNRVINRESINFATWEGNQLHIFFQGSEQAIALYSDEAEAVWRHLQSQAHYLPTESAIALH